MRHKTIQLFALDANHNLKYEGKCKLQIDRISSMLLVEPEHEEYKIKSAKLECGFAMNNNVLFVIAEQELNDFVLIFDEEQRCKKVYDLIVEDTTTNDVSEEMLLNRFLLPLCNRFTQNDGATVKLKEVVSQLVAKQEVHNRRKECTTTTISNAADLLWASTSAPMSSTADLTKCDDNNTERSYVHGKRRNSQLDGIRNTGDNGDIPKQTLSRIYSKTVNQEQYQLRHIKFGMYIRRRLFIFTNTAKTHCFLYSWSKLRKLYYCIACEARRVDVTAIFGKDENGFKCIKMEDVEHICIPLPCTSENNPEMKILKKPDYEIVGNSDAGMMLIIFAEGDKSRCWEFHADKTKSLFSCSKCNTLAKLMNYTTKNEYVELRTVIHACECISYEPNKYHHFNDFYLSTDFEVQVYTKNGKEKKRLIVFDKANRNLCNVYSSQKYQFLCCACRVKGFQVTAKLLQNPNGEENIIFSKTKHICKLRIYPGLPKKEIIVRPPNFELMDNTENGVKKLFIFDSNDRSLCYTFSFDKRSRQRYYCQSCSYMKKKNNGVKIFAAHLCKDENGEYYVRLSYESKHACEPKKFEPENKGHTVFIAGIVKDENGKEYFIHDFNKHICQPINVSSICAPNFVILKRDELSFEEIKRKKTVFDESKIVESSLFEIFPNQKGVPNASLIIFLSEDRNIGHKYTYRNDKKYYTCSKKSLCHATAKLQIQENGEMCLILGKTQHKCEPVNFLKTQ